MAFPSSGAWGKGTVTLQLQDLECRRFFGQVSAFFWPFFSPCHLLPVVRNCEPSGPHACQVALGADHWENIRCFWAPAEVYASWWCVHTIAVYELRIALEVD